MSTERMFPRSWCTSHVRHRSHSIKQAILHTYAGWYDVFLASVVMRESSHNTHTSTLVTALCPEVLTLIKSSHSPSQGWAATWLVFSPGHTSLDIQHLWDPEEK